MTNDQDVEARTASFLAHAREVEAILKEAGEVKWLQWISRAIADVEASRVAGFELVLAGFRGGMGSFNDFVIHPLNGHTVTRDAVEQVNDRLMREASAAVADARFVTRALGR
ncbi:MAG TPA: hypothetical protein GX013_00265 [Propionibacterium sp.]|nr:hypothetical protein [Propionibacterium sp.]